MSQLQKILIIIMSGTVLITLITYCRACNEANCASRVSYCVLNQQCTCKSKDPQCFKNCFKCLDRFYFECCSCIDICPDPIIAQDSLSSKSHIEEFKDSVPELFEALTSESDPLRRWVTYKYPINSEILYSYISVGKPPKYYEETIEKKNHIFHKPNDEVKCSVAYLTGCIPWNSCKLSCQSMGASSFRWFHDGCCQCIGQSCINYGINESKCLDCSLNRERGVEYDDYGQDEVTLLKYKVL